MGMVNGVVLYVEFEMIVLEWVEEINLKSLIVMCMFKFVFNLFDDGMVG